MVPVASAFTFTLIVNVTGVPGSTVTSPKLTLFPSTIASGFVPVISNCPGTSSVTGTVPAVFPLFVSIISYANSSPGFTFSTSSAKVFLFSAVIFTVFISSGSFTSSPLTIAVFVIVPVASVFTFTLIVNVTVSSAGTVTSPKSTLFPSTVAVGSVSIISNCPGTSSVTFTVPAISPVFVTVIV